MKPLHTVYNVTAFVSQNCQDVFMIIVVAIYKPWMKFYPEKET